MLDRYAARACEGGAFITTSAFKKLACDVISALLHLQRYHVLHLDVKLDNILVQRFPKLALTLAILGNSNPNELAAPRVDVDQVATGVGVHGGNVKNIKAILCDFGCAVFFNDDWRLGRCAVMVALSV